MLFVPGPLEFLEPSLVRGADRRSTGAQLTRLTDQFVRRLDRIEGEDNGAVRLAEAGHVRAEALECFPHLGRGVVPAPAEIPEESRSPADLGRGFSEPQNALRFLGRSLIPV